VNCICGCGRRLERGQIELNLVAGEVAIELVAWDKVRALGSPIAAGEVASLLAAGAPRYQRLLEAIHGADQPGEGELVATRAWLDDSRAARLRLHEELPVPKKKIKLSAAEQARIDRRHPERSFSGAAAPDTSELEALLVVALADVRAGRPEEAERALRRFLSEGS
jgi:hypothetical protein